MNKIIAFPQMGDYAVPVTYLLKHIVDAETLYIPKISSETIELGSRYSPDFVCTPFKYTLGTYIECLNMGANVLIQLGGGCRYGYYHELQEQILKDLNYHFMYINLVTKGKTDIKKIIKQLKKIDSKFSIIKGLYYFLVTKNMIKYMDKIDDYIRFHIGFEKEKGSFKKIKKQMLNSFSKTKGLIHLSINYHKYLKQIKQVKTLKKPLYKVGIIGELYTLMEPTANFELEQELANFGIAIKRYTNATYLLFEKSKKIKSYLKKAKQYIKYKMGADAADNIARCIELCENKYDGIIHIKSSFCTPEIGASLIIKKICHKYDVPLLEFSFDTNTSKVGMKTRVEAFVDMIEMRKENEKMLFRD